jgi:L-seryl-tRNA(Ser) seleniumtransferase
MKDNRVANFANGAAAEASLPGLDETALTRATLRGANRLPSVDRVLGLATARALIARYGRTAVLAEVRQLLDTARAALRAEGNTVDDWHMDALDERLGAALQKRFAPRLRRVINLTGTVLHTNLGRATLPDEAVLAAVMAMTNPCNLEYDLDTGGRGDRDDLVAELLRELTGCEAATVVNNNAAAVFLALNSLARNREVVVSRGELIEIGGAFRLPDIMSRAGCRMREVGTTNRTHLRDYAEAIGPKTGLIVKAHTSNYVVTGFTAAVSETDLGALSRERGVPFMVDMGSGALLDLSRWGLPKENTARETLERGASLVMFSGDKLLGGPQAGIIVGTKALIERIKKNPLKRAMRVNKMTLAALEAVLALYRDPDRLSERLTTLRLLTRPQQEIAGLATRLLPALQAALADRAQVTVEPCASRIGSGALPIESLPSACLSVRAPKPGRHEGRFLAQLERAFRTLPTPVIGRISEGALCLDLRCLEDEAGFVAQLPLLKEQ